MPNTERNCFRVLRQAKLISGLFFSQLIDTSLFCMPNSLKRDSVVFIDEINGFNGGFKVSMLRDTLRMAGVVWCNLYEIIPQTTAECYDSSVTHFVYCMLLQNMMNQILLCREDIENIANFPQGQEESRQFRESIQYMHVNLCKRAIADGKIIISVDNILCEGVNLCEFLHSTIGSACKCSPYSARSCFSSMFGVFAQFFLLILQICELQFPCTALVQHYGYL